MTAAEQDDIWMMDAYHVIDTLFQSAQDHPDADEMFSQMAMGVLYLVGYNAMDNGTAMPYLDIIAYGKELLRHHVVKSVDAAEGAP